MKSVRRPSFLMILLSSTIVLSSIGEVHGSENAFCSDTEKITCRHGGTCKVGKKVYPDFLPMAPFLSNDAVDGMYCDCDESLDSGTHTGVKCGVKYEVCPDSKMVCYHGAPCVENSDGSGYLCDCSQATSIGTLSTGGEAGLFAGKHCEMEASSLCGEEGHSDDNVDLNDGQWFCTNGAICRPDAIKITRKCNCKDGFRGPHCEFYSDENTQVEEKCDLDCHAGECKLGVKDYNKFSDLFSNGSSLKTPFLNNHKGQHCVCPRGHTGLRCEIEIEPCGQKFCFHGSKCVHDVNEKGEVEYFCDCNEAHNSKENLSFAGEFCEHSNNKEYCSSPGGIESKEFFCVNGGTCPDDSKVEECDCPSGFTGARCEFPETTSLECDLDCMNDGQCFFGLSNFGPAENVSVPWLRERHIGFMHCKCPPGFTGLQCEIPVEICGDGDHLCVFGSSCTENDGKYECNCDTAATEELSFAGKFCEHPSTSFCAGSGKGSHSFCTNNGECKKSIQKSEKHPGCVCEEGFEGDHCELQIEAGVKNESLNDLPSTNIAAGLLVALCFLVIIPGTMLIIYKRKKKLSEKEIVVASNVPEPSSDTRTAEPNLAPNAREDEEQYEMKDIEII